MSRQADNPDGNVYTFIVDGKSYPKGYKVDDFEVRLALYQNHYFIYNIAPCSTMFVDNYKDHKDDSKYFSYLDLKAIENKPNGTICYRHNLNMKTSSIELIHCLFKEKLMT